MLNERIYGNRTALAANPFATARDDEPQFVEWGYGGMGSVKGERSAGVASGDVNRGRSAASIFSRLGGSRSSTSSLSLGSASAKFKPKPPASKPFNRHKGIRMLNGRVYGSKHTAALAANPFATEEPQFVEWGYGGMGSVKGGRSAGVASGGVNWERLHDGPAVKEGMEVGTSGRGGEEDDGSGMGWVKKRKEERERRERERLAACEAEKEQRSKHVASITDSTESYDLLAVQQDEDCD